MTFHHRIKYYSIEEQKRAAQEDIISLLFGIILFAIVGILLFSL